MVQYSKTNCTIGQFTINCTQSILQLIVQLIVQLNVQLNVQLIT